MLTTNTLRRPMRTPMEHGDNLAAFRAEHGRWPSQKAKGELAAYAALKSLRHKMRSGVLTETEIQHLGQVLPGWDTPMNRASDWDQKAALLAAFVKEHGRLPRHHIKNEDMLADWITGCRQGAAAPRSGTRIDAKRRAFLDEHAPGWQGKSSTDQ